MILFPLPDLPSDNRGSQRSFKTVDTHTIETDTFAIFEKSEKGNLLMVYFIWGKKDFRIFLEKKGSVGSSDSASPEIHSSKSGTYQLARLEYLFQYEWYTYDKVAGHGLAHDEVRWIKGGAARYLELPSHFLEKALELVCREFNMKRKSPAAMAV